jgi:hypothetical protein
MFPVPISENLISGIVIMPVLDVMVRLMFGEENK